ncbi:MAG: tRNA preQ1(34) S-adenosylmethionine ribosyltransferase-isomerase QueA, partial [Rhodospirillales bacterium]|nr:tRNA preQ1(34) S-adenosylmethionine ribosyltransferase-isomerase QueA [Rhodospirillales bacterium]
MKTDEFDFDLPPECIALRPAVPRDAARLLTVDNARLNTRAFRDLPELLSAGDVLVLNNTRVIPARLKGKRGDAAVEATLLKEADARTWRCLTRPARKFRPGDRVDFSSGLAADVVENCGGGEVILRFSRGGAELRAALETAGEMPLPPYIAGRRAPDARDRIDYQTLFGTEEGAVAAPTAGLHFTDKLLATLSAQGVLRAEVTLHVGAGTFLPMKADDTRDHVMHSESGYITEKDAHIINTALANGGRVVAIGTTALRILETAADADGKISPYAGDTDLFITPGYQFKAVDLLLTNFHLPRSTLFMLVCA